MPDGLAADIDAEVTVGELTVFGDNESGFASDLMVDADDEVLDIRIDVFAGDVDVVRDTGSVSAVIREVG